MENENKTECGRERESESEIIFDKNQFQDLLYSTSDEITCLQNDLINISEMNGIIKDLMCNNSENIEIIEKNTNISEMKIDNGNKDLVITLKNQNSNRIQKIFGFIICIGIFQSRIFTKILQLFYK